MTERPHRLTAALAALGPAPPLDVICRGAVDVLGMAACAVILMSDDDRGSVAASYGPAVAAVEDLQFVSGEGPCLTAFRSGLPVLEPDIAAAAAKWPGFAPAAVLAGAGAVFALPLQIGAIRLGVLYIVHDRPGALTDDALADATVLADLATMVVLDQQHGGEGLLDAPAATDSWRHRAVVHQATGMVSVQLEVGLGDALARLRGRAFAHDRTLYELSVDVVERRIRFAADGDGGVFRGA